MFKFSNPVVEGYSQTNAGQKYLQAPEGALNIGDKVKVGFIESKAGAKRGQAIKEKVVVELTVTGIGQAWGFENRKQRFYCDRVEVSRQVVV